MCLLTFLPAGIQPDVQALTIGAQANNDGHGFAIVAGPRLDQLIVHRGMDSQAVIAAFTAARATHPAGPALFHSRFTTHGRTILDNCHPFPVGGDARTVLAHNGVLPAVVQPRKGDRRSDTRIAAEDFIPAFGSLRIRRTRLNLARWMTLDNKMVILTVDRRFKQRAYILNEEAGIWDGGIWYSNTGYRPYVSPGRYSSWGYDRHDDWYDRYRFDGEGVSHGEGRDWRAVLDRCGGCEAVIDVCDGECPWCGWCMDCSEMPDRCFCYAPAALDRISQER
jgi:glutamine amidotransferase